MVGSLSAQALVCADGKAAEKLLGLPLDLQIHCEHYASRTMKKLVISDFKEKQSLSTTSNSLNKCHQSYSFDYVSQVIKAMNKLSKTSLLLCCMISGERYSPPTSSQSLKSSLSCIDDNIMSNHNGRVDKPLTDGWTCIGCGNQNYPSRHVCNICKIKKHVIKITYFIYRSISPSIIVCPQHVFLFSVPRPSSTNYISSFVCMYVCISVFSFSYLF